MRRAVGWLTAAGLAALLLVAGWPRTPVPPAPAWPVAALLGGSGDGYARVVGTEPFDFPRDHGPHPGYRHEWWYLTGQLADEDGRRYGFQFTLFRFGLAAAARTDDTPSAWRGDALYMAHFTVTDVAGRRFHAHERFARPALGLAGARAAPFAAWLGPWRLEGSDPGPFPLRLTVAEGDLALALDLTPLKPVAAQGDGGTSRKGPEPGNASRYYSLSRMTVRGRLRLDGVERAVEGSAWLDREWGSSALGPGVRGWDWFGLQLNDGRDLMLYRLRRDDGTTDPYSGGSVIAVDGTVAPLRAEDFSVTPHAEWRAPDGVTYPARWRLRVPGHGLDLDVRPLLADQELRLAVRYWEGAVEVVGEPGGRGYAELTGYAGDGVASTPR